MAGNDDQLPLSSEEDARAIMTGGVPMGRWIIETEHAAVPFEVLIGTGPDPDEGERRLGDSGHTHSHDHANGHGFTSWVYRRDGIFDVEALKATITRLPRSVYRIKGFLRASDEPDHRHLLQAVGMRGDGQPFDEWGERPPTTALVVIADEEHVDRESVEALLDACVVGPDGGSAGP